MQQNNTEAFDQQVEVSDAIELVDLELSFVGGGIGDVVFG